MGQPSFYHATVALSFQIEIHNLDRTKSSFLATNLYKKVVFTKNWVTRSCHPTNDMEQEDLFGPGTITITTIATYLLFHCCDSLDFSCFCHTGELPLVILLKETKGSAAIAHLRNKLMKHKEWDTVKPRLEAHMDMILSEVFFNNIHLIPQDQIVQWHYL